MKIIYGEYLKGFFFEGIANKLTEMGIKSLKGKHRWKESTVKSILMNEKYKNCALLQKHYTAAYLTKESSGTTVRFFNTMWKTAMSAALMSIILHPLRKPVFTTFFRILPLHTPVQKP